MWKFLVVLFLAYASPNHIYAQDSLFVGKVYVLPDVRRPFCVMWGQEWADKEFETEYAKMFDSVAQFIRSNKQVTFELRSHTDARGRDSLNLDLSQKRADDWLEHLIISGIDPLQVIAIGYGETLPRNIWLVDSVYYLKRPSIAGLSSIALSEKYINAFRRLDRNTFEMLHRMNRREELVIVSIGEQK